MPITPSLYMFCGFAGIVTCYYILQRVNNLSRFQPSRTQLGLGALAGGDLRQALRAGFDPGALPPGSPTLADRIFGADNTFLKRTFNVITDPFVLAGMLLHLKFPIPHTKDFFRFSDKVGGVGREFIPGTPRFLPFWNQFRGWPAGKIFEDILGLKTRVNERSAEQLGTAIGKWTTSTGREWGLRDQVRYALAKGGFDRPGNPMWKGFRGDRVAPSLAKKVQLSAADRTLIEDTQKYFDEGFDAHIKPAQAKNLAPEVTQTLRSQGIADGLDDIKKNPFYYPYVQARGARNIEQDLENLIKSAPTEAEVAKRATQAAAESVLAPSARIKKFQMLPSIQDLEQVEDLLQPGALDFVRGRIAANPNISQFSLRALPVLTTQAHALARMAAFTTSGLGGKIRAEAIRMEKTGGPNGKRLASVLNNTYLPLALGKKTQADINHALTWGTTMQATLGMMQDLSKQPGLIGKMGGKFRDLLLKNSSIRPGTEAAAYFFHSTLGLNPASAALNLSQSVATMGLVGVTPVAEAMARVSSKFAPLLGTLDDKVIRKILNKDFPEFVKSGLDPAPFIKEMLRAGKEFRLNAAAPGAARKALEQFKEVSLFAFQRSELFNRLVAFEAGLIKATKDGLRSPVARRDFALKVTQATQFAGDPLLSAPEILLNVSPVLRQFTTFPLRAAELVGSTAQAIGSGAQSVRGNIPFISGRNFGTLGRLSLAAGLLSEGSRQFVGTDLSRFSFSDALPTPREFGAFAPFPVVPPILGLGGVLASDFVGDGGFEQTRRFGLPLLVPGGTALGRLAETGLPGTRPIARFLGRNFADYQNPGPDGRVQIFNKKGNTVARLTPFQIHLRALGMPVGDLQAANELQGKLARNKEVTQQARRDFVGSILDNDYAKGRRLQETFESQFGVPLQIRQKDINRARQRRQSSMLQRQVKSLPPEIRAKFQKALQTLEAQSAAQFLSSGGSLDFVDGIPPANPTAPAAGSQLGGLGGTTGSTPITGGSGPPQTRPIRIGSLFSGGQTR